MDVTFSGLVLDSDWLHRRRPLTRSIPPSWQRLRMVIGIEADSKPLRDWMTATIEGPWEMYSVRIGGESLLTVAFEEPADLSLFLLNGGPKVLARGARDLGGA